MSNHPAQDYTYEILELDSFNLATIRTTSYDSLTLDWNLQLTADDSDGTIEKFVADNIHVAIDQFDLDRQAAPNVTLGTKVAGRWKPKQRDTHPVYNFLTKYVDSYDSETNDLITTHFSVRDLTDSEKQEVYSTLTVDRDAFEINLQREHRLDSVQQVFRGLDVEMAAAWDGSPGAAFDWNVNKISGHGIRYVERMDVGTYRAYFDVPVHGAKYSVTTGIGGEDYSGAGASPRQLAVRELDSAYVEVHCERTDDAVNEDNDYFSIHVHPGDASLSDSERLQAIEFEAQNYFDFNDSVSTTLRTVLNISDSDYAMFFVDTPFRSE